LDVSADGEEDVVMITTSRKIRLARLSRDSRPSLQKDIEYPSCLAAARRSGLACVADSESYALLDVENQQKIPLFPIASIDQVHSPVAERHVEDLSLASQQISRSASASSRRPGVDGPSGHSRATSLGNLVSNFNRRQDDGRSPQRGRSRLGTPDVASISPSPRTPSQTLSPSRPVSFVGSPNRAMTPDKPLPLPPSNQPIPTVQTKAEKTTKQTLKPHILSPLPSEFLLTTGTTEGEPGVGIFVNSDGDVVRGTLEFSRYPSALVIDGGDPSSSTPETLETESDGYILAAIQRKNGEKTSGLEIQRWDVTTEPKSWLILNRTEVDDKKAGENDDEDASTEQPLDMGIANTQTSLKQHIPEMTRLLRLRRVTPKILKQPDNPASDTVDEQRNRQEDEYARRFGHSTARIAAWSGSAISWVMRNPILIRLDAAIEQILVSSQESRLDQARLIKLAKSIRNQEVRSEAEYVSLNYIRQKISVVLFADLAFSHEDVSSQLDEKLLMEGSVDPRLLLSMVPLFLDDIVDSPDGMWIHAGLADLIKGRLATASISLDPDEFTARPEQFDTLGLVKRYLGAWRQKKGFGSIPDEEQVFSTVDAAYLHLLLHEDQQSRAGLGGSVSISAEIYAVVDHNVECWDRAIELLEEYHRLYVLSRLYQSRTMRGHVLKTWRRIIEGEQDEGGEFRDGENEIRKYLSKTRDASLVEEYGTWLAKRNPPLGVQVFTDDTAKVRLPPNQVVQLLRLHAPESVKVYLEHLVFGKKNVQYANELITYYLDNVLTVLEQSSQAKEMLFDSYSTYRALEEPKPTYRQFITDNDTSTPWWQDRLRLLELLGGSHGAGFSYDIPRVLGRIEPFEDYLVPESIILDGRQGRHQQALRLLTHGLGDYHTAVNYCLLGGSSIFHPTSSQVEPDDLPSESEQKKLFKYLFAEFLKIEDVESRSEKVSELLGRFGGWFDVQFVLASIPDSWSVELLSDFLIGTLRRLIHDKTETNIVRALSGVENLRVSAEFLERCETMGPRIIPATDTPTSIQ
jgi:hypothetical protein